MPVSLTPLHEAPVSQHEPHRFVGLDLLRGAAAFAVVGFHLSASAFPHGYLAVDFFFLLSGFVVTYSYQNRLEAGQTSAFARARLIRLYPLYLLGLLLGILLAVSKHIMHFQQYSLRNIGVAAILALFLCPVPHIAGMLNELFPLNTPAWSLFDEAVANLLHGCLFRRRRVLALGAVIALSFLALFYAASSQIDFDIGYQQRTAVWGLARCIFSYSVGIALCLFWKEGFSRWSLPFPLPLLILAASFLVPRLSQVNAFDDLVIIVVIYPLLLWFSINSSVWRVILPASIFLAETSYAIYIIHIPIVGALSQAWNRLSHHAAQPLWLKAVIVVVAAATAIAADYLYDRPIRRRLRNTDWASQSLK